MTLNMTPDQIVQSATAHCRAGRLEEAADLCRQAPADAAAQKLLAEILVRQNNLQGAVVAYRRTLELRPDQADAHFNLGVALNKTDRLDEAIAAWRTAIALRPSYVEPHVMLGTALINSGEIHAAIAEFQIALKIRPDSADAHFRLGLAHLLLGDLLAGWPECEWRPVPRHRLSPPANIPQPRWEGSDLSGRRILLHSEQGHGDTIQFARYVPLVAARGGTVTLEVQPALVRLLKDFAGASQVIAAGQPLPQFDVHCPLMSLPGIFGTTLESIPAPNAYLSADAELQNHWRDRLVGTAAFRPPKPTDGHPWASRPHDLSNPQERTTSSNNYKVGLTWSGSISNNRNRLRSMSLSDLAPLADIPNISLINLQKGPPAAEQSGVPQLRLTDLTADLSDFADTAALIANLDLVISVDTAVAHLAGALGKRVWVMCARVPDWRWLLDRVDCPWYASARLFRQPAVGDWATPVAQAAVALRELTGAAR